MSLRVFHNEYSTIWMDPKGSVVRVVRSNAPFPSLEVIDQHMAEAIRTLDEIGRDGRVLMNDVRAVIGRNDTGFEERLARWRPKLYSGFVRVGVLVRSSVGALQIRRMVQEDGLSRMVMTDEAALIEWLVHGDAKSIKRP
jgi:hypothetical protein